MIIMFFNPQIRITEASDLIKICQTNNSFILENTHIQNERTYSKDSFKVQLTLNKRFLFIDSQMFGKVKSWLKT